MNSELKRTITEMSDADLAELQTQAKSVSDGRRAQIDLHSIKPGMKPEDLARARAEIARIAAEMQGA